MSESQLVTAVLSQLKLHGVLRWRQPSGNLKLGKYWVRLADKGTSDIGCVVADGRYLALECKRPGESLTPEQVAFFAAVTNRGGYAKVVHSVEELAAVFGWER